MKLLVDFHVHSDNSFDGTASLESLSRAAKKKGISALAITDHNTCTLDAPLMLDGVLLIPGCEISTVSGHMTALFPAQRLNLTMLRKNGMPSAQDAAKEVHACRGIAVMAHPFYKAEINIDSITEHIDGAEVFNSRAHYKNPDANKLAAQYTEKFDLLPIAGSDAHTCHEIGNAYTELDCDEFTSDCIKDALLSGSARPVLCRNTPHVYKGVSRFRRARKTKKLGKISKSAAYMAYCVAYDIFK